MGRWQHGWPPQDRTKVLKQTSLVRRLIRLLPTATVPATKENGKRSLRVVAVVHIRTPVLIPHSRIDYPPSPH